MEGPRPVVDEGGFFRGGDPLVPWEVGVLRARTVEAMGVDLSDDARSPSSPSLGSLRLNLFGDATYDVVVRRVRRTAESVVWEGDVLGHEGTVTLAVRGPVLVGSVRVARRVFSIRPHRGALTIIEWSESVVTDDAEPLVGVLPVPDVHPIVDARDGGAAVVDVLVAYTDAARAAAGGTAEMAATIDLAMAEANASLSASGVTGRLELLGTMETAHDETALDWHQTLGELATPGDGVMDEVVERRESIGADMVVLIVDHLDEFAGVGFQMSGVDPTAFAPLAYSVVSRRAATGFYTFAHELGHNLGAQHDVEHASYEGYRPDGHGHQVPEAEYRTVMAYSCGAAGYCPRTGRWSNPSLSHAGSPTGVAGMSNNAATLRETLPIAAQFRERPTPPPPPIAELVEPADGAELAAGAVRFRWSDVGADAYDLTIGQRPGDDSYFRLGSVDDTEWSVGRLPTGGETLYVRVWTDHGDGWQFSDHTLTAYRSTFEGSRVFFPEPGDTLASTYSWFAWPRVEGAAEYRLEVGPASAPGRLFDRSVGTSQYALVAGLPANGDEVSVRLHTRGPDGWAVDETTLSGWRAPSYASVILAPETGSDLRARDVRVRFTVTDAVARWLIVRDRSGVLFAQAVSGASHRVTGLPGDGRELTAVMYSFGSRGWIPTTAGYHATVD